MSPRFLSLAVAVHAEPAEATELIKHGLGAAGAVITGAQRLGNQALVFNFELRAEHALALAQELSSVATLLEESEAKLRQASELAGGSELVGALNVTLVHRAPDQRIALPKVPG